MIKKYLLAAILAAPSTAFAQDNMFHCPKVGTVLEFSTGAKTRVDAANGFECDATNITNGFKWTDHAYFQRVKPLNSANGITDSVLRDTESFWPLVPGRVVEVTKNRGGSSYIETYTAIGIEPVTVPAGSFQAWHLTARTRIIPSNNSAIQHYWWDPKLGVTVKRETVIERGQWTGIEQNFELVAVKAP
jgi:hypothetical protein